MRWFGKKNGEVKEDDRPNIKPRNQILQIDKPNESDKQKLDPSERLEKQKKDFNEGLRVRDYQQPKSKLLRREGDGNVSSSKGDSPSIGERERTLGPQTNWER